MILYPKFAQFLVERFNAVVKKGEEFNFNCPKCGDTKRHFSFNLRLGVSNCFRCGYRPLPFEFLVENTDLSLDEIRELLQEEKSERVKEVVKDESLKEIEDRYVRGIKFPEDSFSIFDLSMDLRDLVVRWLIEDQGVKEEDVMRFGFRVWIWDTVRVVIPCWDFERKVLIYWLARAIADKVQVKYLYPAGVRRSMVFWGLDQVELWEGKIFLCEGWKDAYRMRGLALLGNCITEEQVKVLRRAIERYNSKGVVILLDSDAVIKGWEVVKRLLRERWLEEIWFGVLRGLKDPGEGKSIEEVLERVKLFKVKDRSGIEVRGVLGEVFGLSRV